MSGSQHLLLGAVPQVVSDPYFEYNTLLLPGNGTNGAQNNTFLDSSTNNFTITRNGNTTQGTFSPFSQTGWGNYFDGSGDYLSVTNDTAINPGTGDFTLECWVYAAGAVTNDSVFEGSQNGLVLAFNASSQLAVAQSNVAYIVNDTVAFTLNEWVHVAVVRSGTTLSLFKNGSRVATATNSTNFVTSTENRIGRSAGTDYFTGYISNLRFVKGTAVYSPSSTTLTVPTAPLTAITNTSLLTCQSNRFIDNSTNAFTITRNGDVSVQAFSPFNPTAAWSAATYGGSGYFDGSGDYLNFTDSSNVLDLGGAQDSFECWIYPLTSQPSVAGMLMYKSGGSPNWNTTDGIEYLLNYYQSQFNFLYNSAGSPVTITSGGSYAPNQWYHVAVATNASNAISLYINGTRVATGTNAITKPTTRTTVRVGVDDTTNVNYFNGYISGSRFINGSGAYDASQTTITVPTAPVTAVTNTALLLNYTNGAIFDATSKNDLETVGNAQISTTQSKFGGSSMYFDGTGDYLFAPSSQNLNFRTGDFTIEGWIYLTSTADAYRTIMYFTHSSGSSFFVRFGNNTSYNSKFQVGIAVGTASDVYSISKSMTDLANGWHHFAFTRSGTTCRVFINGTQENVASGTNPTTFTNASFTNSTDINTSLGPEIGRGGTADTTFIGYINDLRVTRGYARYTASFTAPTAAFPVL